MKRFAPLLLILLAFASAYHASPAYAACSDPTPTPGSTYSSVVLGTQSGHLLGYWKLDETGGTTAADSSGNSRNGTYSGPTLNSTPFTDGSPAPSFDGVNDYVNVYGTSLASAMNFNQGTLSFWVKADATFLASTTSGVNTLLMDTGAANGIQIFKSSTANTFFFRRYEASTNRTVTVTMSSSSWTHFLFTWNVSGNAITAYINGSSSGTPSTAANVTATLASTRAVIGVASTSANLPWKGGLAQIALWDTVLSGGEISALAASPSATPTPVATCTPTATLTPSNTPSPTITPSNSPSPTLTPSNTPTPSNTANIYSYWTLPAPASTGTAIPGQIVRFDYSISAGQSALVVLLGTLFISLWVFFLIWLLLRRRSR